MINNRNNNNNNNNRRRGRGNRNQPGGGNQGNRIDSRARGNAPQLLDKFRKLAEDAHRNGDRVQAEYYLQFADHYFRVIADNRNRQDEQRGGVRREDREQDDYDVEDEDDGDNRRFESRDRDDRVRDTREMREPREGREGQARDNTPRDNREREPRQPRPRRDPRRDDAVDSGMGISEGSEGAAFEPNDNPFMQDTREPREDRPKRRAPRPRRDDNGFAANGARTDPDISPGADNGVGIGIDASALPPSFSVGLAGNEDGSEPSGGEDAAPRRRRKRSDGGTLSAVG